MENRELLELAKTKAFRFAIETLPETQEIFLREYRLGMEGYIEQYINLREQKTREALISLGWTPPKDSNA